MLPIFEKFSLLQEYLLTEMFGTRYTEYGSDLTNSKFIEYKTSYITYFKFNNFYVLCRYDNDTGEFGYGICDHFSINPNDYIDKLGTFNTKEYLSLLNSIIFIFSEFVNRYPIVYLYIRMPDKQQLSLMYDHVFNNKSFLRALDRMNFKYERVDVDKYSHRYDFTRKRKTNV